MKAHFLLSVFFSLLFSFANAGNMAESGSLQGGYPEVEVVMTQKKIHLLSDELPIKDLDVQVLDKNKKIVMEQHFSSKTSTNWSLDIKNLPAGNYTLKVGKNQVLTFEKKPCGA